MTLEEIKHLYDEFGIPDEMVPSYNGPEEFASRFKACGILHDAITVYGDSTADYSTNQ